MLFRSLYENMPNSVLEAMAAGLPVLATPVGAIPEMVAEGESGFLVAPGDRLAIADRLARLVTDPALRHRLGAEGARIVRERYDFSALERRLSVYYRDLA